MSSTLNRGGLNFTNYVKDLTFSKNTGSFVTFNNTKPFKNMLSNSKEQNNSETKLMGSNYDKQLSESSSNKHKNTQHFNGISTQNFNRTMAFGLGGSNTNSKKLEEQVSELKYMLENVQCEAKNLKLLLNLKDDQIQMYESKNQDLICENEELNYKCEESKLKIDQIEEETLYFKALINNHNQGQNLGQKSTIATNIEKCVKKTQSTQANFPQMIMKTSNINSVGLSPIKEEIDHQLRSKDLSVRLEQSEKENINLMNMIQDYLEKVSKLERENDSLKSNLNIQIKEKSETKKQYASENKSLYWQLENTKRELTEREQRLGEAVQALDEIKIKDKKKSSKIKSLKKERDALRIEILKLKQIYSEKCDGYKENRIKLQRKLKKRDEHLSKLENQLSQYEKFYRNQLQSSNVQTSSHIQRHENLQQQMNKNQRDGDQGQLNIRSSVSSRSLENTRNLSSTAKGVLRGLNQIGIRQDNSKETSQNVREILQNAYQPIISLSNSPKQKNLTPGSLPSGMGINGGKIDQYQKEKVMMKLKSHYKRLEVEEEKIVSNQNNRAGSQFSNNPPTKNYGKNQAITQVKNNHFISNDKSKSFYSSDIENNTLFDQNHIVMEDQSNSSNFFSNINNSNSHLFLDDSAITKALDISQNNIQKQYGDHSKMIQKIDSLSQIRATSDAYQNQVGQYQPVFRVQNPGSYQPIYPIAKSQSTSNNRQQQQRNIISQMQSIQPDEAVQNKFGTIVQSQIKQNQQHQYPATTKSPISQISAEGKRNDATVTYAPLNKSNQNLSQSDLNPNTQNSIRYHRNDSATSSNRNLHQIKDSQQRPPSTSSTNNTSNLFHNQVAMISYQSSSSGGSKHYQNKLSKLQGLNQMPLTPAFQPYHPQKNSQPTNSYHSQVSGYPVNYSQQHQTKVGQNAQYQPHQNFNYPKDFSSYNQNSHQIPQYQVPNQQHYSLMNTTQTSIEDKYQSQAQGSSNNVNQTHKRQRSRQLDGLIPNQDQQHIIQQQQNIQSNNFGSKNQQHINHQQNQYHERFDNYSSANQYPNHNYQQYLTSDKNQVDQRTSKADYAQQQKYLQHQNIEQIQKQKSQYQK